MKTAFEALDATIELWNLILDKGLNTKPEIEGVLHDCHLCQYVLDCMERDGVKVVYTDKSKSQSHPVLHCGTYCPVGASWLTHESVMPKDPWCFCEEKHTSYQVWADVSRYISGTGLANVTKEVIRILELAKERIEANSLSPEQLSISVSGLRKQRSHLLSLPQTHSMEGLISLCDSLLDASEIKLKKIVHVDLIK